jgi:hypothetical protein
MNINEQLLIVEAGCTYSCHFSLKGYAPGTNLALSVA